MSMVATGVTECLNCASPLSGPFCASCGQKTTAVNPTVHDVVHEFTHEVLHVDGRLFHSVKLLFTRPGLLTREHNEGRRAGYLAPLRLYLIFSVLYFAAAALVPRETTVTSDPKQGKVVRSGGVKISGDLFLGRLSEAQIEERVRHVEHDWLPKTAFVLVPVWALLVMAVTRRERRHFPEHLYFSVHAHAAFFAVLAVGEVVHFVLPPAVAPWWLLVNVTFVVAYTVAAMHTVYGGTWPRATLRSLTVLLAYSVVLVVVMIAVFAAALLV